MYISFNELCSNNSISSICNVSDGRECINNFVGFLHLLKTNNLLDGIATTVHCTEINVCAQYGIKEWLSDPAVKKEHKQFLRTTWDKLSLYIDKNDIDSEFSIIINGKTYNGTGLVYAIETNNKSVSILTNLIFKTNQFRGIYRRLDYEKNDFIEESKSVFNLYFTCDIDEIKQNVRREIFEQITSGQDLWEKRQELFPNLVFCESVKDQLYKDPEKQHIISIIKRLEILQKYFDSYETYNYMDIGFSARSESDTVQTDPSLSNMRRFKKPDGSYEYFYDHISFTGKFSGGRIYFLPDNINKKFYVGYIGRHLPTQNY